MLKLTTPAEDSTWDSTPSHPRRTSHEPPGLTMRLCCHRLYTNHGDTLAYVCELEGDTMTIWMGQKGSPAVCHGTFSADGNTIEGAWEWPGGGYQETMTRARAWATESPKGER